MKKIIILLGLITVANLVAKSNPVLNSDIELMRMNLYASNADNTSYLADGTLTQYGDYSNLIDGYDARKMTNPGINVSLIRGTTDLVIERRQTIGLTDTIFFRMWNMIKTSYRMELVATNLNHPGLQGFLEDNYLNVSTPLSLTDTTNITFAVTPDPASSAQNRFRIIFKSDNLLSPPTVHFIALDAANENRGVDISWQIENENNMKQFFIQKSADGISFQDAGTVSASSSNIFEWSDYAPYDGKNYYRIKAIDLKGKSLLSPVIYTSKVNLEDISLFPIPATSNNLNLKINNQQVGNYDVLLCNLSGQPIIKTSFYYSGGKHIEKLHILKELKTGFYVVTIIDPNGHRKVLPVILSL